MAVAGKVRAGLASHPVPKCQPRDSSWKRVGDGDREWWGSVFERLGVQKWVFPLAAGWPRWPSVGW